MCAPARCRARPAQCVARADAAGRGCRERGMSIAQIRLSEERKNWRRDHPYGFIARPGRNADGSTNLNTWEASIPGRAGTPWEVRGGRGGAGCVCACVHALARVRMRGSGGWALRWRTYALVQGGNYVLDMFYGEDFPATPPKCKFREPVPFHVNVFPEGYVYELPRRLHAPAIVSTTLPSDAREKKVRNGLIIAC